MTSRPMQGLTLIEMLVALLVLALMATLSGRTLDTLLRSQRQSQAVLQDLGRLHSGLAQWRRDLARLNATPYVNAIEWDGQVLRLVRRSAGGDALQVVAWAVEQGQWRRWPSSALRDREALLRAWDEAPEAVRAAASQEAPGPLRVEVLPVDRWELEFHQRGQWASPPVQTGQESGRLVDAPQAVRLRLIGLKPGSPNAPLQIDTPLAGL